MRLVARHISAVALALASVVPAAASRAQTPAARPTAREVVERIRQQLGREGVSWSAETVDTFKDGDPDAPVTGIALTMMATLDVLQRAAAQGANLVITHEPTFYGHLDRIDALEQERDPVLAAKRAFIREKGLVVWRFHDHWHRRRPDGIIEGMTKALGWERFRSTTADTTSSPRGAQPLHVLTETPLRDLAATIRERLGAPTLRVLGDPAMRVRRVALIPGAAGFQLQRAYLQRGDVEVLVIGEAPEWETALYVADAVTAKHRKAMIVIGHIPSEQAGMEEATRWLRAFVGEVPVHFVPAREPFWR